MSERAEQLWPSLLEMISGSDSQPIFEQLSREDSLTAAAICKKLQIELYWKRKDLPRAIEISQAGITRCLNDSDQATDATLATSLRSAAKQLAYNLGSFTWPGWDEAEISVSAGECAIGLDASRLNLRLAHELNRPAKGKANAEWLLGAHLIAACDYAGAIEAFDRAKAYAVEIDDPAQMMMLGAYRTLASVLQGTCDRAALDGSIGALRQAGSEDADAYAAQLPVALKVFEALKQ